MAAPTQWHEPEIFASGDTLNYQRNLPSFLPSNGWSIKGTLTQPTPNGSQIGVQFASTPSPNGNFHVILVENFASGLTAGQYVLSEIIVCSPTGESPNQQFEIYNSPLTLDPNLQTGLTQSQVLSFAQQWLPLIQAKLLRMENYDFIEGDIQRSRFIIEDRAKTLDRLKWCLEKINWEKKQDRQRNTGQNQMMIQTANVGGW